MTTDPVERKTHPITTGVLDYFPDAVAEVANASFVGNEQHHAGEPLHWDKDKSTDEADCLVRHLMQRGTRDTDGVRHTAKVAWRALALLQREIDAESTATHLRAMVDDAEALGLYDKPESPAAYYQRVIEPAFDERQGSLQDTPDGRCEVHMWSQRCVYQSGHIVNHAF